MAMPFNCTINLSKNNLCLCIISRFGVHFCVNTYFIPDGNRNCFTGDLQVNTHSTSSRMESSQDIVLPIGASFWLFPGCSWSLSLQICIEF